MSKVFRNTDFVNLFGDPDRPVYGNELVIPAIPSPTPTPIPSQTPQPSQTPLPTPTPTPVSSGITEANLYLQAIVDAGGVGIDSSVSGATRDFFVQLFDNGLWDKMIAFYPFIGSTPGSHKFNGKDPRDLDEAFRLTFYGGITHEVEGIVPNGLNGYGDTHILPLSFIDNTEGSLGSYIQTTATTKSYPAEIGVSFYNQQMMVRSKNSPNLLGSLYAGWTQSSPQLQDGLVVISRTSYDPSGLGYYQRGVKSYSGGPNTGDISGLNYTLFIGGSNNRGSFLSEQSDRVQSFAFIGYGLNDGEVSVLSDMVNNLQTALGRNTY